MLMGPFSSDRTLMHFLSTEVCRDQALGENTHPGQQTKTQSITGHRCCFYLQGDFLIHITFCDSKQACYVYFPVSDVYQQAAASGKECPGEAKLRPQYHADKLSASPSEIKYKRDTIGHGSVAENF